MIIPGFIYPDLEGTDTETYTRTNMPQCVYVKLSGEVCGRNHGAKYNFCAAHRPRPPARPFHACATCGTMTRLTSPKTGKPLCMLQACGMYEHQIAWRGKKRAKAREEATARIEEAKRESEAQALDDYVEDLLADFSPEKVKPAPSAAATRMDHPER